MQQRLDRWEARAEWPLATVAAVFLAAYSVNVLAQPQGLARWAIHAVSLLTWAAFTADYAARLYLADDRKRWFRTHLIDLAVVVLPLLRPLRLLRLIVLIGALQKAIGHAIRGRVVLYTISGAIMLVYVSSLAVLQTERGAPGAHITNFGDAVWWAITTITTVGYGDMYPVTTTGRVIAALLMIGGISLVGSITATIASWIVQHVSTEESANAAATASHINELRAEIALLREELRRAPVIEASGTDHRP
ncbi:potassium channel family protein [Mycolicibacterium frederiksbergense]|nr:potassium channel family protein [Mycolicibacterium frederiksbergense]